MPQCNRKYEITALKDENGWYVGAVNPDGSPRCRLSMYYETYDEAKEKSFTLNFIEVHSKENSECNGGWCI